MTMLSNLIITTNEKLNIYINRFPQFVQSPLLVTDSTMSVVDTLISATLKLYRTQQMLLWNFGSMQFFPKVNIRDITDFV